MIIDGKQISQSLKDAMKIEVDALAEQYGRRPCLMVVIVGNNPASRSYVRGKIKATEYCGFDGHLVELPEDCSEATLLAEIDKLNNDPLVDGILVQLPLPKHISEDKVIAAISAEKDVTVSTQRTWHACGSTNTAFSHVPQKESSNCLTKRAWRWQARKP